ncbi:hypothetical protein BDZ45DRAFT_428735 [Acephala macrosclerotiorum]|nr:hypothetical protein BDZ45DRAFT_428735 [Acephala macrosclerotiorum]
MGSTNEALRSFISRASEWTRHWTWCCLRGQSRTAFVFPPPPPPLSFLAFFLSHLHLSPQSKYPSLPLSDEPLPKGTEGSEMRSRFGHGSGYRHSPRSIPFLPHKTGME